MAASEIPSATVVSAVGSRNSSSLPARPCWRSSGQSGRVSAAGMPRNGSVSTVETAAMTRSSCGSGRSKTETWVPQ